MARQLRRRTGLTVTCRRCWRDCLRIDALPGARRARACEGAGAGRVARRVIVRAIRLRVVLERPGDGAGVVADRLQVGRRLDADRFQGALDGSTRRRSAEFDAKALKSRRKHFRAFFRAVRSNQSKRRPGRGQGSHENQGRGAKRYVNSNIAVDPPAKRRSDRHGGGSARTRQAPGAPAPGWRGAGRL